jgi:adenylate cyclase
VAFALLLGVAASVAVTVLSRIGALSGWETRAVDAFLFFRNRVPAPEIVLVVIDEEAFRELGERQPVSRRYLAELGEFLLQSGARVVAFDVLLKSRSVPEEDAALVTMARRWEGKGAGRLVFATLAVDRKGEGWARYELTPPFSPELYGLLGFTNAPVGPDGLIRHMVVLLPAGDGGFLPSFPLAVLAAYGGQTAEQLTHVLKDQRSSPIHLPARNSTQGSTLAESISLSTLSENRWRIDFTGPQGSFISFASAPLARLARTGQKPNPENPFKGKIVLVGGTFRESRDFYPTPTGLMSGIEIQANMVHTLLSRRALLPPHWLLNLAVLIGACLWVSLLSLWFRPLWVAALSVPLIAAFITVSYEAYIHGGYWLDFVAPLVGMLAYLHASRVVTRRRLRAAFGQYVSPEVMDRVLRDGASLGGEMRTVSVLIADLRGFTRLSERLDPEQVFRLLSAYFTSMIEVIMAQRGLVQDFIGDAILAVYGAPAHDPDHAWHAVFTALELQAALQRLNRQWQGEIWAPLAMGVAVHTGEVFAGNVGSLQRKKYAVLGDPVNTVTRLERLNREFSTTVLISGATLAEVKGRVAVRDRGEVLVKGRRAPVQVFELVGLATPEEAAAGR